MDFAEGRLGMRGFGEFMNHMVLDDDLEYEITSSGKKEVRF
jgi:hypothetical protein